MHKTAFENLMPYLRKTIEKISITALSSHHSQHSSNSPQKN